MTQKIKICNVYVISLLLYEDYADYIFLDEIGQNTKIIIDEIITLYLSAVRYEYYIGYGKNQSWSSSI